ncbi:polysaccharide pyruvyl transferase family protein [Salinicola sp. DM10]|uniref:polysaccharide pyruvyl transferase family protein n=1 Tax=Salinicola sp. DM10 TaxID=2815721 RepID=UPI001A8E3BFA|nr:polysaccharide pyruvyl transferase family protein [Salinicola sp. DM10]MCE3026008.1 polysaccharide pyruvyl transferase family protein [Salinicola sp. DM10]
MRKPKIGLVGYFGWGNYGDELFMRVHNQFLSERYDLEVVHDSLDEPYFSTSAIEGLKDFDGFLIGGGDLVNPNAVSSLYWRNEYLEKPVFVHGIGCPNLKVKQSKALSFFHGFFSHPSVKHICLRDVESKQYFDSVINPAVETVTYPDSVFAMNIPTVSRKISDKVLGVVLRSHKSLVGEYEQVRKAVDEAKSLGYRVRIIVAAFGKLGEGDLAVSNEFSRDDEEVFYSDDLMELSKALGECSLVLSMKFHALVVGTMYGVPVIQMSSTQKNRNLFRYLQRPDLLGNYHDEDLFRKVPPVPAPIHSLLVRKLRRDSEHGYHSLLDSMNKVFGL